MNGTMIIGMLIIGLGGFGGIIGLVSESEFGEKITVIRECQDSAGGDMIGSACSYEELKSQDININIMIATAITMIGGFGIAIWGVYNE